MSWRNLDKKQTDERKKDLRRGALQNLKNMEKRIESLTTRH
jgi:hypothetical protein